MSAPGATARDDARRQCALRALGIMRWVRRAPGAQAQAAPPVADSQAASACVVVLPADCGTRELDLLGRALAAYGVALARAPRIAVRDGHLTAAVPPVRAYLVLGQAQAHALGRELPGAVMNRSQIVLADEPAQALADGAGKRRLWTALRQLRRALTQPEPAG